MAINLEVEHIQPQAAGGLTRLDNLCLACPSCNRYKGSRQTAVDPDSGEIVSLFHPQKQIWIEHFSWINDASQIAGKTAIGRATMVALQVNRPALVAVRKLWVKLDRHPPN
ncbi:MAG: HNH endonuclease [Oscillatoriales cyanobacterium]|nr:MAG: HNH endonuclease [Oscillatoriales cyanobacterium]